MNESKISQQFNDKTIEFVLFDDSINNIFYLINYLK